MKNNQNGNFKLALVTGAGSGIGEALCHLLASKKINLIITGRDRGRLDSLADKLKQQVQVAIYPADLSIEAERKNLIHYLEDCQPDLVINNAGFGAYGECIAIPLQQQVQMLEVNAIAVMELSIAAAKMMAEKGMRGVIMNISSAAAFASLPLFTVYSASKSFVTAFSESFDLEMRDKNIRILAACPGMVKTNFSKRAGSKSKKPSPLAMTADFAAQEIWKQIEKKIPVRIFNWKFRLGTFMLKYLIPKSWGAYFMKKEFKRRLRS